jgi:hypothetical protein
VSTEPFSRALRPPRLVLGPGLWIFGALLWSYVVLGQFVVKDFPEGIALLTLALVVGVTYAAAVRDSLRAVPAEPSARRRRWLWPGVAAFGFWLGTTLLVTAVGKSSNANLDAPITLLLLALSVLAIILGRRFTHPGRPKRSLGKLALFIAAWLLAALATLAALSVG